MLKINEVSVSELISPNYHFKDKRAWYLLRFKFILTPTWGEKLIKSKISIFREIAYVDENNELFGLGRSYLPFNLFGFYIFFNCIKPFAPKPLGVVLKKKYGSNVQINIISTEASKKNITPFRIELTEVISYKRVLSIKNNTHKIIVEEDIIK